MTGKQDSYDLPEHEASEELPGVLRGIRGDDPDAPALLAKPWVTRRIAVARVRNRLSLTSEEALSWLIEKWLSGRIASTGAVGSARKAAAAASDRRAENTERERRGLEPLSPPPPSRGEDRWRRLGRGFDHFSEADLVVELDQAAPLFSRSGPAPLSPDHASPPAAAKPGGISRGPTMNEQWLAVMAEVGCRLEAEGGPETLAEVERLIHQLLGDRGLEQSESLVRKRARLAVKTFERFRATN